MMKDKIEATNLVGKFIIKDFPQNRQILSDLYNEFLKKHYMIGYVEINISKAKSLIKQYFNSSGEKISFTGWIVKCVANSVKENPELNSYRKGKTKIVEFEDIDIIVMIEREIANGVIPVPHSIRRCNTKSLLEISREIRQAQIESVTESDQLLEEGRVVKMYKYFPKFFKQRVISRRINNPIYVKKQGGMIVLTSVGMFANTSGWIGSFGGITTLNIGLGGINKKLVKKDNDIVEQEFLQMTLSLDHDIIDGAPAARFVSHLINLMENGTLLIDLK